VELISVALLDPAQVVPEVSSALRPLASELLQLLRLQGPQDWVAAEALQVGSCGSSAGAFAASDA
jgi:hypothetical protein